MNMSMNIKYRGNTIINYSAYHWWLTGFNPRYLNVNAASLSAVYTIDFSRTSKTRQMYKDLLYQNRRAGRISFGQNYRVTVRL